MTSLKVSPPSYGAYPDDIVGIFQAKGAAFSAGDVVMVAMDDGATYTSDEPSQNTGTAATTSPFTIVKTPTAAQLATTTVTQTSYCWFGVCQEAIAQNAYGRVMLRGRTKALTTGTITRGLACSATTSKQLTATTAAGSRVLAWPVASGSGGAQVECYFDGVSTPGTAYAS